MAAIARPHTALRISKLPLSYSRCPLNRITGPGWRCPAGRPTIAQSATRGFRSSPLLEKKYTKDHEWVELNDDKTEGTIGITHYAASALGEVVYVELPEQDLEVTAGDSMGAVESVKSANDIMTPVTGKVIATNEKLQEKPSMINKGPEAEGWIARLQIGDAKEVDGLMDLEAYRKHTEE
ncbi:MAG: hypothetical protein Q9183_003068 [Haloplaca sp. 2 TL-2023]